MGLQFKDENALREWLKDNKQRLENDTPRSMSIDELIADEPTPVTEEREISPQSPQGIPSSPPNKESEPSRRSSQRTTEPKFDFETFFFSFVRFVIFMALSGIPAFGAYIFIANKITFLAALCIIVTIMGVAYAFGLLKEGIVYKPGDTIVDFAVNNPTLTVGAAIMTSNAMKKD